MSQECENYITKPLWSNVYIVKTCTINYLINMGTISLKKTVLGTHWLTSLISEHNDHHHWDICSRSIVTQSVLGTNWPSSLTKINLGTYWPLELSLHGASNDIRNRNIHVLSGLQILCSTIGNKKLQTLTKFYHFIKWFLWRLQKLWQQNQRKLFNMPLKYNSSS